MNEPDCAVPRSPVGSTFRLWTVLSALAAAIACAALLGAALAPAAADGATASIAKKKKLGKQAKKQVKLAKKKTKKKILKQGGHIVKNSCRGVGNNAKHGVKCKWVYAKLFNGSITRNCKGSSSMRKRGKKLKFKKSSCKTDKGASSLNSLLPQKLLDGGYVSNYVFCFTTLGKGYDCVWEALSHKDNVIEDCNGTAHSQDKKTTYRVLGCAPNEEASTAQAGVKDMISGDLAAPSSGVAAGKLAPGKVSCTPGSPIVCDWSASYSSAGWTYTCNGTATASYAEGPYRLTNCKLRAPDLAPLRGTGTDPVFGVNESWVDELDQVDSLASDFGAQTARFTVNWTGVQSASSTSPYDWTQPDLIMDAMKAEGIKPVLIISSAPCWATSDSSCGGSDMFGFPPDADHLLDWARFAAAVAERYKDDALAIEVWNEANARLFYQGGPRPNEYTNLLKTAYTAIKSVQTSAGGTLPVLTTGTAAFASNSAVQQRYDDFLRDVYEAGGKDFSDGIGHHAYPGGGPSADYEAGIRSQLADLKDVMIDFGDQDKPIWITETGVSAAGGNPFSENQQATAYAKIYKQFRRIPGVPTVITHRWRNFNGSDNNPESGFGLKKSGGGKKPVYCSLAQAVTGADPGGC